MVLPLGTFWNPLEVVLLLETFWSPLEITVFLGTFWNPLEMALLLEMFWNPLEVVVLLGTFRNPLEMAALHMRQPPCSPHRDLQPTAGHSHLLGTAIQLQIRPERFGRQH